MTKSGSANFPSLAEALRLTYGPDGWATKLREAEDRRVFDLLRRITAGTLGPVWFRFAGDDEDPE